jgi:polyketide synthase PksN
MNSSLRELIERYRRGEVDKSAVASWLRDNAGGGRRAPAQSPPPQSPAAKAGAGRLAAPAPSDGRLAPLVEADLLALLSRHLKVPVQSLEPGTPLDEFGFDSISLNEFRAVLENRWSLDITTADLIECTSIEKIAAYLIERHGQAIRGGFAAAGTPDDRAPARLTPRGEAPMPGPPRLSPSPAAGSEPIAIIGMSGAFPGSPDLETFWRHLAEGHDLISQMPAERRARWRRFEGVDKGPGGTQPYPGGFMADVDKFDSHFFNLSPREAELMDPQQRLVLETVWHTLEDAGYRPSSLAGSRVGFFIAVTGDDYTTLAVRQFRTFDPYLATGCNRGLLANRVSHFFNWRGPSEPVDTACSSSLLAVHRAVKAIRAGECDTAVAGGVNLLLAPTTFVALAKMGMLASNGRCKPFDERADGFVRGEGVGAVMLKPLSRALADGDTIRAVIRGSATNHAGKTSSLTVPSSAGQAECMIDAMEGAGFDPASVSYIETHGTGTKVGDPVEISALQQAFAELGRRSGRDAGAPSPRCGIGSVKSNVGHLEGTAGIVALIKVVLALEHRMLPGLLHFERLNPAIALGDGPFYIVDRAQDWEPVRDFSGQPMPLRAGVNSFGFGGVNVHVAIEEFAAPAPEESLGGPQEPQVVVLSAKTRERLRAVAARMREFLRDEAGPPLRDVAYTLRERREGFAERLAFVARTRGEAAAKLDQFLDESSAAGLFVGRIREKDAAGGASRNGAGAAAGWEGAALEWSRGAHVDWSQIYRGGGGRRIRLPHYPFERRAHWLPEEIFESAAEPAKATMDLRVVRDPEGDAGTFFKELKGDEFYLADHRIGGKTILPGVAYLELAWSAAAQWLGPGRRFHLRNVVWIRPILFEGRPLRLRVAIRPNGERWRFEISGWDAGSEEWSLHSQGTFVLDGAEQAPPRIASAALADVRGRSALKLGKAQLYGEYASVRFDYGPGLTSVEEMWASPSEVLASVRLPHELADDFASYALHPSILDGALQAVMGFPLATPGASRAIRLPFSVGELRLYRPLEPEVLVHFRAKGDRGAAGAVQQRYDIDLIDDGGRILLSMRDFVTRRTSLVSGDSATGGCADGNALVYGDFAWREPAAFQARASAAYGLLLLGGGAALAGKLAGAAGAEVIRVSAGGSFLQIGPLHWEIDRANASHYGQLLDSLRGAGKLPQGILHAWSLEETAGDGLGAVPAKLESGLYSLVHLVQAWIKVGQKSPLTLVYGHPGTDPCHVMVDGFLRSLVQELPSMRGATVQVAGPDDLLDLYAAAPGNSAIEAAAEPACQLRKRDGRWEQRRRVVAAACEGPAPLMERGVYLITGAMGGLGRILATHLAVTYRARLVLCGRAALDADKADFLGRLRALGAEAEYESGDIREPDHVRRWVRRAGELWGGLHGIFHCAGAVQDGAFHRKSVAQFQSVLEPKLAGTVNLFEASRGLGLEFVALFSSVASVGGSRGQTDYATANRFLDAFAARNAEAPADGDAPRRVVSINWPLWADGGMKMPAPMREKVAQVSGMAPLPSREGIFALENALRMDIPQVAVFYGDASRMRDFLHLENGPGEPAAAGSPPAAVPTAAPLSDDAEVGAAVLEIVSSTLKVEPGELDPATDLSEYGVDSIMAMQLVNRIEERFGGHLDTASITEWTIGGLMRCLSESGAGAPPAAVPTAAPLSDYAEVGAAVLEIVSSTLKVLPGELDPATDLSEYGVDSIMAMQLVNRIEERFGCHLDTASITEWTIGGLVRVIAESGVGFPVRAPAESAKSA